jgi:dTDP-4-dehydrorhamnose 3,5-epimerase
MNKVETGLEGLYILETNNFIDKRGSFQKLFSFEWFTQEGLATDFKEFYFSVSQKNVIRGMHFQLPPNEHIKLVYVSKGSIIDVVVDLRKKSTTYGKAYSTKFDDTSARFFYIPVGFAHGFLTLEDETIVNYAQTSCYNKESDSGILYNSFDFIWESENPIVSERYMSFKKLEDFTSLF